MSMHNAALLADLEALGTRHGADTVDHAEWLLNITPDTGQFLSVLVRATGLAPATLEVGDGGQFLAHKSV
jgi:predicted O-methyltransferase YrrM